MWYTCCRQQNEIVHSFICHPTWLWLVAGTHNSFCFHLDESGDVAPGSPDAVQSLATLFGVLAKKIISNWSKSQSLGVDTQLKAGVRYFDVRVSGRPGSSELFVVHGLYGPTVESCLDRVAAFLDEHCYEVVFIDFNHFYDMDDDAHDRLIKALLDRLDFIFYVTIFLKKILVILCIRCVRNLMQQQCADQSYR